jgi:vitamin B12 transporter
VRAEESDNQTLSLFTGEKEQVASTSVFPRPLSRIAENVTVITAEQIARINAHTLAEVLQTLPGVQLDVVRTPGSFTFFNILNNTNRLIQLLIDGIPQGFLSADNLSNLGSIPVQQIEQVEVVKGAASVAWGSALGGVVNVITKSPDPDRAFGGLVSASAGERLTTDLRGELSGTSNRIGYYLTGGNLHSNGLLPGNRVNFNHAFGKFTYELPAKGNFTLGLDYRHSNYGLEDVPDKPFPDDFHDTGGFRNASGYLAFSYPLAYRLSLELNGHVARRELLTTFGNLSIPDLFSDSNIREISHAENLRLFWGDNETNLVAGFEYEHTDVRQREPIQQSPLGNFDLTLDRWGVFLNGAYTLGPLTLLPGLRYDHTNLYDGATSYNLGATFRLTDQTLLRAYAARGYSLPIVNSFAISNGSKRLQNIWTVQAGVETAAIPYLWLKGTYFYNELWDIEDFTFPGPPGTPAVVNLKEQRKQGVELEAKTSPLYGFSLAAGYTFTDARDQATGDKLPTDAGQSNPPHGLKLAVNYTNSALGLLGALTGNYVWWNATADRNGRYKALIWDLHLNQKLFPSKELSPELFFSAHNLFSGAQYQRDLFKNTPRWFEGGVRFRF